MPWTGMRSRDIDVELRRKHLVADEHVVLVAKDRMRAGQPAGP